ncbi:uncharacterized protein [Magallana gigas]|uniref:uncharacterized protein n=1 Tax=Magallana gigas TaxID=29159 RepID=UPI00333E4CE5
MEIWKAKGEYILRKKNATLQAFQNDVKWALESIEAQPGDHPHQSDVVEFNGRESYKGSGSVDAVIETVLEDAYAGDHPHQSDVEFKDGESDEGLGSVDAVIESVLEDAHAGDHPHQLDVVEFNGRESYKGSGSVDAVIESVLEDAYAGAQSHQSDVVEFNGRESYKGSSSVDAVIESLLEDEHAGAQSHQSAVELNGGESDKGSSSVDAVIESLLEDAQNEESDKGSHAGAQSHQSAVELNGGESDKGSSSVDAVIESLLEDAQNEESDKGSHAGDQSHQSDVEFNDGESDEGLGSVDAVIESVLEDAHAGDHHHQLDVEFNFGEADKGSGFVDAVIESLLEDAHAGAQSHQSAVELNGGESDKGSSSVDAVIESLLEDAQNEESDKGSHAGDHPHQSDVEFNDGEADKGSSCVDAVIESLLEDEHAGDHPHQSDVEFIDAESDKGSGSVDAVIESYLGDAYAGDHPHQSDVEFTDAESDKGSGSVDAVIASYLGDAYAGDHPHQSDVEFNDGESDKGLGSVDAVIESVLEDAYAGDHPHQSDVEFNDGESDKGSSSVDAVIESLHENAHAGDHPHQSAVEFNDGESESDMDDSDESWINSDSDPDNSSSKSDSDNASSESENDENLPDVDKSVSKKGNHQVLKSIENMNFPQKRKKTSLENMNSPQKRKKTLSREECDFDIEYPNIFIKKFQKGNNERSKTGRTYDLVHSCMFCHDLYSNIQTHIENKHANKKEVQEIKTMKQKKEFCNTEEKTDLMKEINRKVTLIRNKGDNIHNMSVLQKGEGEILLSRRTQNKFSLKQYGPCPECFEWIQLEKSVATHRTSCPAFKTGSYFQSKGSVIIQAKVMAGKIIPESSKILQKEVLPAMRRDSITDCVLEDHIILMLGDIWLSKNIDNKRKRKHYASYHMRLAGRLLLLDLCRLASVKLGNRIKSGEEQGRLDASNFLNLMKLEWTVKVTKIAKSTLNERHFNAQKSLPDPEDIAKLAKHITNELTNFDVENMTPDNYRKGVILSESRLLLYNRRRPGELEALSLKCYENRSKEMSAVDKSLRLDLTDLEKQMLDTQHVIEVRGKTGKRVPVICPKEVLPILQYLANPTARRKGGVKPGNPYLFANTANGVVKAGEALDDIKEKANLRSPHLIYCTNLRKHCATIAQVIGLQDHEMKWLCQHLGHTQKVHAIHYRATSGMIERIEISKLMLMQETSSVSKFAGKNLRDIQFEGRAEFPDVHVNIEGLSRDSDLIDHMTKSLKPFVLKDHSKLQTCLQSLQHHDDFMTHENKKQRNYFFSFIAVLVRKGVNFDEFFLDILGDSDTTNDSNDLVDTNDESNDHVDALDATSENPIVSVLDNDFGRRSTNKVTRVQWSKDEEQELREYLSEYIGKKCPGMKACKYAIEQSKKNGGKIQYRKWDTIKKKVVRMNPL